MTFSCAPTCGAGRRLRHTYRAEMPPTQARGDRRPGGVTVPLPPPRLQAWFGHTPSVMSVGHHGQAVGRAVSLPHSCCAPRQHRRAQNLPARTPRDIQLAKSATAGWDMVTQLAQGERPESTTGRCSTPMVQQAQLAPVSALKPAPGPACASPSAAVQVLPQFLPTNPPAVCWKPAAK